MSAPTMQGVAQTMLDRYGFFVVRSNRERCIGEIVDGVINAGYSGGAIPESERLVAKIKIVARATPEDVALQNALVGYRGEPSPYDYRAVAE